MEKGWISIYRDVKDHWIWSDSDRFKAWVNMLMTANYEDKKVLIHGELIECKRGQSIRSLSSWSREFGWSIQRVRTFFELLEDDGMIKVEGLRKTTRLTICKYDSYQKQQHTKNTQITDKEHTNNKQRTNKEHADNTQITTNNKENKENKGNKENKREGRFSPPALTDLKNFFIKNDSIEREAEKFHDHFEANGWKVGGRTKMKDWKAAARNWIRRSEEYGSPNKKRNSAPVPKRGQDFGKL